MITILYYRRQFTEKDDSNSVWDAGERPQQERAGRPPGLLRGAGAGPAAGTQFSRVPLDWIVLLYCAGLQARLPPGLLRQGTQASLPLPQHRSPATLKL